MRHKEDKLKIFTHDYYGHTVRVLKTDDGEHWANIDEFTHALEKLVTKH